MDRKIRETKLPGVGTQLDFETELGDRVGIITHHTGRHDFLIFSGSDPDLCASSVSLTEDESRLLGQMLGASQVVESIKSTQLNVGALVIDWIPIQENWACTINDIQKLKLSETDTQIIAVIRGEETYPAPESSFQLHAEDVVVLVGKPEGINQAYAMLMGDA